MIKLTEVGLSTIIGLNSLRELKKTTEVSIKYKYARLEQGKVFVYRKLSEENLTDLYFFDNLEEMREYISKLINK